MEAPRPKEELVNRGDDWASPYDGPQTTEIQVLSPDGSLSTATVRWWVENGYELVLEHEGRQTHASALDYFEAFQQARRRFEADGLRFLCYGASKNASASGMARDMGLGLKVYLIILGEAPARLVHIFDSGPDMIPATVEENHAFILSGYEQSGGEITHLLSPPHSSHPPPKSNSPTR